MIAKYVLAPRIKFRDERGTHTLISYYAGKEGPIRLRNALSLVLSAMWDTVLSPFSFLHDLDSFASTILKCSNFFFYYTFLECL